MPRLNPKTSLGTPKPKSGSVHLPYTTDLYTPSAPPPGTYSPVIEQEVEAERRKLNNLLGEIEKGERQGKTDLGQKRREVALLRQQSVGDQRRQLGYDQSDLGYRLGQLGVNFTRSIEDLGRSRQRGQQDYERTLTNLQHEYGARAEQQSQNAVQQGTDEAGTNTASTAVRGANQAHDKEGFDISHGRAEEDLNTQEGRVRQDYGTDVAHAEEGFGRQQEEGQLSINRANQSATRQQKGLSHAWLRTLGEYAEHASHATAAQAEYEEHQAQNATYEAHKLHPNMTFPGGTQPGATTTGPALAPGKVATAAIGIGIGRGRRLTPPRY
jgi:hypothetical protein